MRKLAEYIVILILIIFSLVVTLVLCYKLYLYLTRIDHEVRHGSAYGFTIGQNKKAVSMLAIKYSLEGRFENSIGTIYNGSYMPQERFIESKEGDFYTFQIPKKAFEENVWVFRYREHDWLISERIYNTDVLELRFLDGKLYSIRRYRNYFVM